MPGMDSYVMWTANGQPLRGVMKQQPGEPAPPHWIGYIGVSDVDATVKQAQALGGGIIVPGTDIPTVGTFHASYHAGYNKWYVALRRPLQRMVNRLAVCTAVSEEATRDVEAFGVQCEILFNGVEVEFYRDTPPTPSDRPAISPRRL